MQQKKESIGQKKSLKTDNIRKFILIDFNFKPIGLVEFIQNEVT